MLPVPGFSNNPPNNIISVQVIVFISPPVLSLYSFDQLDRLVFLWQIAVWLNWFLNSFLGKRRQGISVPLLSYVSNKIGPLPMFYGSTVENRQGSTISDLYESHSDLCLLEWEFKTRHSRSAILFGRTMRRLKQISRTYSFESSKISIWFGACKMRRLNRA